MNQIKCEEGLTSNTVILKTIISNLETVISNLISKPGFEWP